MSIQKNLSIFDSPIIQKIYKFLQSRIDKVDLTEIMAGTKLPRSTCVNNLQKLQKYDYINSESLLIGSRGRPHRVYWSHVKSKFEDYDDDDYLNCDQCQSHIFIRISSTVIECKSCNCRFAFNLQE